MDKVEARLIADIVKSGSTFFKSPSLECAGADEGTTLRYDAERDRFVLRRYEVGDSEPCKNHRVEPLHYSSSVNMGGANRYVHLEVSCLDCGHRTVYDFDD